MKVSLIPWEYIWLVSVALFAPALIRWIIGLIKAKKFSPPASIWFYLPLLALLIIPAGLRLLNYQFILSRNVDAATLETHPVVDLRTRFYPHDDSRRLYDASVKTIQNATTYGQPWTITFAEFEEESGAARLGVQIPVFFGIDTMAVVIHSGDQFPYRRQMDVYSTSKNIVCDFGENARHIKHFFVALEQELSANP